MDASATRAGNTRPDPKPAGFFREVGFTATCEPMLPPLRLSCASPDGRQRCQVVPVSAVLMACFRPSCDFLSGRPTAEAVRKHRACRGRRHATTGTSYSRADGAECARLPHRRVPPRSPAFTAAPRLWRSVRGRSRRASRLSLTSRGEPDDRRHLLHTVASAWGRQPVLSYPLRGCPHEPSIAAGRTATSPASIAGRTAKRPAGDRGGAPRAPRAAARRLPCRARRRARRVRPVQATSARRAVR